MKLSPFESIIFSTLEASVGETVTKTVLEAALCNFRKSGAVPAENSNVLQVLVRRIRRKLPSGSTIEVIRGVGYKLRVVAMCDECKVQPGTHTVLIAGGTETFICDDNHSKAV